MAFMRYLSTLWRWRRLHLKAEHSSIRLVVAKEINKGQGGSVKGGGGGIEGFK